MKKIQRIMAVSLFIVLMGLPVSYAGSQDDELGPKSATKGYGSSKDVNIEYSTYSLKYIDKSFSSIKDLGDGNVQVKAYTYTSPGVDSLKLDTYLERWNGSSWTQVTMWTVKEYNKDYIGLTKNYKVTKGCRYRVRTIHTVTKGGITEFEKTVTSYISL